MPQQKIASPNKTIQARKRSKKQIRNAEAATKDLIAVAEVVFAENGLSAAKVDDIAEQAGLNKKMIYHYFGSKEALYIAVLENAYHGIRQMEEELSLSEFDPVAAISQFIEATWKYFVEHPHFLALINQENLMKARYLQKSSLVKKETGQLYRTIERILKKGADEGIFRKNVDVVQLNHSIAGLGFYYLNNRFTNTVIYGYDHMAPNALEERKQLILEMVLGYLKAK
ncbi:Nicotinate degradation protein S [Roseibium album]|nr:Nicotinate degradation protein S [Roseibium album]